MRAAERAPSGKAGARSLYSTSLRVRVSPPVGGAGLVCDHRCFQGGAGSHPHQLMCDLQSRALSVCAASSSIRTLHPPLAVIPPRGNISHESGQTGAAAGDTETFPAWRAPLPGVECSPGGAPSPAPAFICFSLSSLPGTCPLANKAFSQSPAACCRVRRLTFRKEA